MMRQNDIILGRIDTIKYLQKAIETRVESQKELVLFTKGYLENSDKKISSELATHLLKKV